jgi:hypothetical protein
MLVVLVDCCRWVLRQNGKSSTNVYKKPVCISNILRGFLRKKPGTHTKSQSEWYDLLENRKYHTRSIRI